jgi:uncharacterized protein (TIGR03437 family)
MRRLCALLLVFGACAPTDGPQLDRIEPGAAARGSQVMLRGVGFCGSSTPTDDTGCLPTPSGAVDFSLHPPMVRATIELWLDDRIGVTVPASVAPGTTTVYVTVDGRSSNGVSFEVLP